MIVRDNDMEVEVRIRCAACGEQRWERFDARVNDVDPHGGIEAAIVYRDVPACGCGTAEPKTRTSFRLSGALHLRGDGAR